jgi:hypothetical protein
MVSKGYRPPIKRLQEEWAFRLRMERLRKTRGPKPATRIEDNSEPWIAKPSSVAEFWEIARHVNELTEKWAPRPTSSSGR